MFTEEFINSAETEGDKWQSRYIRDYDQAERTLTITVYSYPNPLILWSSIYPMDASYQTIIEDIKSYYGSKGIKCIVAGPIGLGGIGIGDLGFIINWIYENRNLIKYVPLIYKISKVAYIKIKREKEKKEFNKIQSVKPKIEIKLSLYIKNSNSNNHILRMKEFLISYIELHKIIVKNNNHLTIHPILNVVMLDEGTDITVNMSGDPNLKLFKRFISKISKTKYNEKSVYIDEESEFKLFFKRLFKFKT